MRTEPYQNTHEQESFTTAGKTRAPAIPAATLSRTALGRRCAAEGGGRRPETEWQDAAGRRRAGTTRRRATAVQARRRRGRPRTAPSEQGDGWDPDGDDRARDGEGGGLG